MCIGACPANDFNTWQACAITLTVDYKVWFIHVADEKARFVALVSRLKHSETKTSQFFVVSDISIALVTRDIKIGTDVADDQQWLRWHIEGSTL